MAFFSVLQGLSGVQRKVIVGLSIFIGLLLAALGGLSWLVLDIKEQNGVLSQQNNQHQQTIKDLSAQVVDLRAESQRIDFILVEKDRAIKQLKTRSKKDQQEIVKYASSTAEVKKWSDDTVPAHMVDRLLDVPPDSGKDIH